MVKYDMPIRDHRNAGNERLYLNITDTQVRAEIIGADDLNIGCLQRR